MYSLTKFILERNDRILTVWLDNPKVNVLNKHVITELNQLLNGLEKDRSISVVIFTGKGKVFSAGADLKERANLSDDEVESLVSSFRWTFQRLYEIPQVTICAINGVAYGGGLEFALACDLRLMAKSARIGLKETSLSIIPGAGGTQRLARLIGEQQALYWILTAKDFFARDAESTGLILKAVSDENLLKDTRILAEEILRNGPAAIPIAKQAVRGSLGQSLHEGLRWEEECYRKVIPLKDRVEAIKAFLEKRKPRWSGK
jgi:enoyl-CoA hydratase/carnithine racemase